MQMTAAMQTSPSISDNQNLGMSDDEELRRSGLYGLTEQGVGETFVDLGEEARELGLV